MNHIVKPISLALMVALGTACSTADKVKQPVDSASAQSATQTSALQIDFEKFELDNGLQVIFHIDRSDPVVAVALTSHVGSARELPGRTGFAHLFEHLLFLESENLGRGGLDQMSARIGGSGANGSTSRDRTNYFQTVPNDALEKMLWAEADKLGYFINTVTEPVLAKEKQVVKNEKRQGVDNTPYGHTQYVIDSNLYPEGHPYSWQVIGSLEDLQNATLQDVKDFYNNWYTPNNVTLVVSGDFDVAQAKAWVAKYFDEIPAGPEISRQPKQPANLSESKRLYHEDNFAQLPELTVTWPTVPVYHPDSYALDVLTAYLSEGKGAPLYQQLVENNGLTDAVYFANYNSELAGQAYITLRTFDGIALDEAQQGIEAAFAQFELEGIAEADLQRIKAEQETAFYQRLSSVLGKGFYLAQYNIFAGDPGFINQDIQNLLDVSQADVMRVYNTYIKNKPTISTSFVPKGQTELVLSDSQKADVVEEQIVQGAEQEVILPEVADYPRTASSFDRTVEPPYGATPSITVPQVWQVQNDNGLQVFGIQSQEVPLVEFSLSIDGGLLSDTPETAGVANLMAEVMDKGTANKSPEEFENAVKQLGASLSVQASAESIVINGTTLARNYPATLALVSELLLSPRWDEQEFALAKQRVISAIQQQQASPRAIAANKFNQVVYGQSHIFAQNVLGNADFIESMTLAQVKQHFAQFVRPQLANLHLVGDIDQQQATLAHAELSTKWQANKTELAKVMPAPMPEQAQIYFYDIPDAKQSILTLGYPTINAKQRDFYPAHVMNYRLGGGGFASILTQQLREGKGYTYGIRSRFSGSPHAGTFSIYSGVRTNVTLEAVTLIKDIVEGYAQNLTEDDLALTRGYFQKSSARKFETFAAKLNMLQHMSQMNVGIDYIAQQAKDVDDMTQARLQQLAQEYIRPQAMQYIIVGDAKSQLPRLSALGLGEPVRLN